MGDLSRRSRPSCASPSSSPAPVVRMPACTHGARSCRRPARGVDLDDLVRRLNKLCAPSIAVRDAVWTDDDFDARFSATYRHYRYDVWNAPTPNPLLAGRAWFVPQPLDPMGDAGGVRPVDRRARLLVVLPPAEDRRRRAGAFDGRAACCRRAGSSSRIPAHLRFEIRGTAFCHQMVRSIVGTLVDVGLGKASPATSAGSSSPATARPPARSPRRYGLVALGGRLPRDRRRSHPMTTVRHVHGDQLVAPDEIVATLRAAGHTVGRTRRRWSTRSGADAAFTADDSRPRCPRSTCRPCTARSACSRRSAPCATSTCRTARRCTSTPRRPRSATSCARSATATSPCRSTSSTRVRERLATGVRLRPRRLALRHRRPLPRARRRADPRVSDGCRTSATTLCRSHPGRGGRRWGSASRSQT